MEDGKVLSTEMFGVGGELRRRSAWERWNGENWAKEFAQGNEVDILKRSGLWNEAWD